MFRTDMTLDRSNRIFTGIATVILVVVVVVAQCSGHTHPLALIGVVIALGLAWAMAPRALVVDDREVTIERRMWPALRFPREDIASAAPVVTLGKRALRLWGVGGFFGSYGLFWSDTLGRFRLYGTRRGQAVIVVRKGSLLPVVVTPDDVAGAINAIDTRPVT
jgi:hypothetical protein